MLELRHPTSLSSEDALWLYLERDGQPLNIAATCTFEGIISIDSCTRYIESKLPEIPRYLQRLVPPPLDLGLPTWQYDPDFDIRNHVREVKLKRGTETEFKDIAGQIVGSNMDHSRPLWDLTLVRGLKGNRTGLIIRIHHCLADGTSGVALMQTLLELSPTTPKLPKKRLNFEAPPVQRKSLVEGLFDSFSTVVERSFSLQSQFLEMAQGAIASAPSALSGNGSGVDLAAAPIPVEIFGELAKPPYRLPFNVICKGRQVFEWAEIPIDQIKAVKNVCEATVNDVVLTLTTDVIRRYAELHGRDLTGRSLHIIVPVNLRSNGRGDDIGNHVGLLPLSVPLDIRDPLQLLFAVRKAVAASRKVHLTEVLGVVGTLVEAVPTPVQAALLPMVGGLPLPLANTAVTNVPGPQFPLYLLGHKLLNCYPYIPIGSEMGLNSAVMSYNGTVYFAFCGYAEAIPDISALNKLLATSFADLCKAAGIRVPGQKVAKTRSTAERKRAVGAS